LSNPENLNDGRSHVVDDWYSSRYYQKFALIKKEDNDISNLEDIKLKIMNKLDTYKEENIKLRGFIEIILKENINLRKQLKMNQQLKSP